MTNLALPIDQAARHIRTGNDRTTPESVLRVVRPIDLDPCSNPWSITKARVSFSKHNCLTARPWHQLGRVCVFSAREAA